jgi:hypothetical protein
MGFKRRGSSFLIGRYRSMDASALAKALDSLEQSWSSLDWWLNFWTIVVVIGVAVELIVLITEYTHEWRDFKRGIIHAPEKPSLIIFGLGFLGAGMVAIGVAGEFRIHVKAGKIETDMRNDTRQLVAIANERASKAEEHAAALDLARVQIEKSMEWRHLSKGAKDALCTILPPPTQDVQVMVVTLLEDPEPRQYAIQFADTIGACFHMPTRGPMGAVSSWPSPMKFGVWIEFPPGDAHLGSSLHSALKRNGVDIAVATQSQRQNPNSRTRMIFVGPRVIPGNPTVP